MNVIIRYTELGYYKTVLLVCIMLVLHCKLSIVFFCFSEEGDGPDKACRKKRKKNKTFIISHFNIRTY